MLPLEMLNSLFEVIPKKALRKISLLVAFLSVMVIPTIAYLQTSTAAGSSVTLAGSLGLLVSLGIENVPGVTIAQARLYYNWISFGLVVWIAFAADDRSSTQYCLIATGMAALTAWFGWFTTPNPVGKWGLIILCALLSVSMYMTEKKRVTYGVSGGGDPMLNVLLFVIIFQATIGLINGVGFFQPGQMAPTPSTCGAGEYTSCSINGNAQLTNLQNTSGSGNVLNAGFDVLTTVALAGWNLLVLIIQIAISLVAFSYVIVTVYPWITQSAPAIIFMGIVQLGIWFIYTMAIFRWIWKPMPGDARV